MAETKFSFNSVLDDKDASQEGFASQKELDEVKDNEAATFVKATMNNATLFASLFKILVSSNDTNSDFILNKLVAGLNLAVTEQNDGANENLLFDVLSIATSAGAADSGKLGELDSGGKYDGSMIDEADDAFTVKHPTIPNLDVILDAAGRNGSPGYSMSKVGGSGFMQYMPNSVFPQITAGDPTAASGVNAFFLDSDNVGIMYLQTLNGAGAGGDVVATKGAALRPSADLTSTLGTATKRWGLVHGDGSVLTNVKQSFLIWAERKDGLNDNKSQWSFGDGMEGDNGIVMMRSGRIIGLSLHLKLAGTSSVNVEVRKNHATVGKSITLASSVNDGSVIFGTPEEFAVNDAIGFFSILAGSAKDGQITALCEFD